MSDDLRTWARVNTGPFHFADGDGGDPEQLSRDRLRRMSDTELLEVIRVFGWKLIRAWWAEGCKDPIDRSRLRAAAKAVPEILASLSDQERHDLGIVAPHEDTGIRL